VVPNLFIFYVAPIFKPARRGGQALLGFSLGGSHLNHSAAGLFEGMRQLQHAGLANAGPKICNPTGSFPQIFPHGTDIPGRPASEPVTV